MNIGLIIVLVAAGLLLLLVWKSMAASKPSAAMQRQLSDGKKQPSVPETKSEKLPPNEARRWLDDFLRKQQE